jgi:hypothetical protein
MQGGRNLGVTNSSLKVTEIGSFSARSRVTFESNSGGSARTCVSPFSAAFTYRPGEREDGLIVFPNPYRSGNLAIETLQDLTNVQITISSITGQVVYREKMDVLNIHKEIDLKHLPEGVYIFKLTSATFTESKRIIIDY